MVGIRLHIGIVAHEKRKDMAEKLAEQVGANLIAWDAGHGPRETHERAWRELKAMLPAQRERHWAMVIEDDAVAISEFRAHMITALAAAPTSVVSAYLGRGRPADWQHSIAQVMAAQVDWLIARAMLSGVGVALRATKVPDMLAVTSPSCTRRQELARWSIPMDEAMDAWVRTRQLGVSYCHPSLLDHDPNVPSLIGDDRERTHSVQVPQILGAHHDPNYRKAWHFGTQTHWTRSSVTIPTPVIPQV